MRKVLIVVAISMAGCTSAPKATVAGVDHAGEEQVLARIDGLSSRPSYISESQPFKIEGGYVVSLGQTIIPADHSLPAAYRIASNSAKVGISTAIEQRLETIFQNAEDGTAIDATQARYIGSEVSKLTTSSLRLDRNYWEKVATIKEDGQRVVQYRVFSTVKMPEGDFKTAVMDAIKRGQGKGGLSKDFAKKVDSHWNALFSEQHPAQRPPASVEYQE